MAEIQQLRRKLDERVLERAEADPQWKRQFIEDPPTAVGDMPEAQRLREIDESGRTVVPPTEEYGQLQQSLTEKVLDRAANDPLWKQRLLSDPEAAMRQAGFPELKRLDEIRQEEQKEEVRGHVNLMTLDPAGGALYYNCHFSRSAV
jgi:hypothetical protein